MTDFDVDGVLSSWAGLLDGVLFDDEPKLECCQINKAVVDGSSLTKLVEVLMI